MKIHPLVGAEILERVQFPYPVVPIVRAHHEKWDGTGYPQGLTGNEIPIGARILAAVDCLDALASDRQYRRALPMDEAMGMLTEESGKAFDPRGGPGAAAALRAVREDGARAHVQPQQREDCGSASCRSEESISATPRDSTSGRFRSAEQTALAGRQISSVRSRRRARKRKPCSNSARIWVLAQPGRNALSILGKAAPGDAL